MPEVEILRHYGFLVLLAPDLLKLYFVKYYLRSLSRSRWLLKAVSYSEPPAMGLPYFILALLLSVITFFHCCQVKPVLFSIF